MKNYFLILPILSLLIAGCDNGKGQAQATGSGASIERQEDTSHRHQDVQKEQYHDDDANITTPIDGRPDLEEEE